MSDRYSNDRRGSGETSSRSSGANQSIRPPITDSRADYERQGVTTERYYGQSDRTGGNSRMASGSSAPQRRSDSRGYSGSYGDNRNSRPQQRSYAQQNGGRDAYRTDERYAPRTSQNRASGTGNSGNAYHRDEDFYPSTRRTTPQRRKKQPQGPGIWLILLAVIVLAFFGIRMMATLGVGTPTYYAGLSVNGIPLEGYTYENGVALLRNMVDNRLNSTYTLDYNGRTWQFTPASDIAAHMDVETQASLAWNIGHVGSVFSRQTQINQLKEQPINLTSALQYDSGALDAFIESIRQQIDVEPVNAEVRLTTTEPELIGQSQDGYALDTQVLKQTLIACMENGGSQVLALPVITVQPEISSDTAVGGLQRIVDVSTDASMSSKDRLHNIQLAMRKINTYVLEPGQQFSYNAVVGKRTEVAGFKEATAYSGNTVTKEIGGGICQVSSTLYQAVLYAGLKVDERNPHSMTVSYTEAGKDATVSDNANQDLKFTNNTDHTIYIYAYTEEDPVTGKIMARVVLYSNPLDYNVVVENQITERVDFQRVYENDVTGEHVYWSTDEVLKQYGKAGCRCATTRIFYDAETGEKLLTELMSNDTYRPLNEIYWRGIHNPDGTPNR